MHVISGEPESRGKEAMGRRSGSQVSYLRSREEISRQRPEAKEEIREGKLGR